jgi:hypothetical protein
VSWVLTAFLSDQGRVRRIEIRRLERRPPD